MRREGNGDLRGDILKNVILRKNGIEWKLKREVRSREGVGEREDEDVLWCEDAMADSQGLSLPSRSFTALGMTAGLCLSISSFAFPQP